MVLGKYSMGIGDRFCRQGKAQLRALDIAARDGIEIEPVWNKSHREHTIVGTRPESVRAEADAAEIEAFVKAHRSLAGSLSISGISEPIEITEARIAQIARKYLLAVREAGGKPFPARAPSSKICEICEICG